MAIDDKLGRQPKVNGQFAAQTGSTQVLRLESIAAGGDALAFFEGKAVFVEGGAPNETVLCHTATDKKNWARAELLEIIEPSPYRIEKTCAFYGKCGGCNLQHINYAAQLDAKTAILKDSFLQIGSISPPEPEIFPSPPWEYRNRLQLHRQLGFKGRQSGEIIAVSDCPVAVPGIRDLLKQGGKVLPLPPGKDRFTVFSKDGILLSEGGREKGKINLLEKTVSLHAGVFFQSNCCMLEKLILELQKIAEGADRNLPMADLYCGVGTFALFLGEMFPRVILAEENKAAVSLARENLKSIDKSMGAEFFALRDSNWPQILLRQKAAFGFAVIDPPRAGLSPKLAAALALKGPPVLAYVSCDPASLARDAKILVNGGYQLTKLMFFDFYPQTAHIESLAVFMRNSS